MTLRPKGPAGEAIVYGSPAPAASAMILPPAAVSRDGMRQSVQAGPLARPARCGYGGACMRRNGGEIGSLTVERPDRAAPP